MKKLLLLLLCTLLALPLTACAGNGNVEEDSDGIIEEDRESGRVDSSPAATSRETVTSETAGDTETGMARGILDRYTADGQPNDMPK